MVSLPTANCISGASYIQAASSQASAVIGRATTDAAIATALALYQRTTSASITELQNEIAQGQVELAEAVQQHAEKFWPIEQALVENAFGTAKHSPDYASLPAQWKQLAAGAMDNGRMAWIAEARRYCLDVNACDDARWQRSSVLAQTDVMSFAARQAEGRAEALNDRRYENRYAALQLGRGQLATISGYQAVGLTAGGSVAGMLAGTINSALEAYGYYTNRQPSPQWGHAAQVRAKWGVPYSPPAVATAAAQAAATPAQTSPAQDSIGAVTVEQLPSGKDTEFSDGLEIYQQAREQGLFR